MEAELRPYFDMNLGAWQASLQTGHRIETCTRYWDIFNDRHMEAREVELGLRQRKAVNQFETSYDKIIFNLNAQLNKVIGRIQEEEKAYKLSISGMKPSEIQPMKLNKFLEDKFTEINELLAKVVDAKTKMLGSPFIDEDTEAATLYRMQEKLKKLKEKEDND